MMVLLILWTPLTSLLLFSLLYDSRVSCMIPLLISHPLSDEDSVICVLQATKSSVTTWGGGERLTSSSW